MITIKEFSSLCSCNAQTLRYYDRIGLLKPVRVDPWSGYRYYEKSQAIDFVKIKNFQAASFSISEIKNLLTMSDQQVCDAFDQKIAEQQQKLEQIQKIRQSYLAEKNDMERLVRNVADYILHTVSDYEVLREFGLFPDEGPAIVEKLRNYIKKATQRHLPAEPDVRLMLNGQVICGADRIADTFDSLKGNGYDDTVLLGDDATIEDHGFPPENSEILWESHGWSFVHEFIGSIPALEKGVEYCFCFQLSDEKYRKGLEFPLFMITAMLPQLDADEIMFGCSVERSSDGLNHFALTKRT